MFEDHKDAHDHYLIGSKIPINGLKGPQMAHTGFKFEVLPPLLALSQFS